MGMGALSRYVLIVTSNPIYGPIMRIAIINRKFQSPIWLVALPMLFANCNSSDFGAVGVGSKDGAEKAEVSKSEGETLGQNAEDDEDLEADKPVEVSGAFLTCEVDETLPKTNDVEAGFGCTVFERDGRRKDLTGVNYKFVLEKSTGEKMTTPFSRTHESYHGISVVDKAAVSNHVVGYYVDDSDAPAIRARIDGTFLNDATINLDTAPEEETIFGSDSNFHIGDGNFSNHSNGDCPRQLVGRDVQGKKIVVKIEVKSEYAAISANLGEICGVDRSRNYIVLTGGNGYPQKSISTGANSLEFDTVKVQKGSFSFEIRSGTTRNDLDDFVVGKITFKAKGEVVFSDPRAEN
jgi:hypothetical protein